MSLLPVGKNSNKGIYKHPEKLQAEGMAVSRGSEEYGFSLPSLSFFLLLCQFQGEVNIDFLNFQTHIPQVTRLVEIKIIFLP